MQPAQASTATPRHWAYPWLMGFSLGVAAVGCYGLGCYFRDWPWGYEAALALWALCFGGVPVLAELPGGLAALLGAFLRGWRGEPVELAGESDAAPVVVPPPAPLVGGYLLSEREQFYYEGLLRLFQHAAAADSLTSPALIGPAFTDPKHWGFWTDLAAHSGFCVKSNGVTTVLPKGRTYAWVVAEIRKGNILWPGGDAPALEPLPHPFVVGLSYGVNVGKAAKGLQKAAEGDWDD